MAELIVALDLPELGSAEGLVEALREEVSWFKVGLELFTVAGPEAVKLVKARGAKCFLDLKLHDIPETVVRATAAAGALGADLLTLHAAAGEAAIRKAAAVAVRPKLLAVTVLTSDPGPKHAARVLEAGRRALDWGCEGLVCSPVEAAALRLALGKEFLLVTPGVRPAGSTADDHARSATPTDAVKAGANYLVVGRPIRDADDPRNAARSISQEIRAASGT